MEKGVFPTKEAGDYLNSELVSIKYNLDKSDVDNIKTTYDVKAFPTFIFLDGNGKEVARMLGGARDTKGFITRVEKTIAKENSWEARNARFKSDQSYAMEHIAFLKGCYMEKEAEKLLIELFGKRSIEENFNDESVKYYTKNIYDLKSPIIKYMLDNKKEVMAVMGKYEYNTFIGSKANSYINANTYSRGFDENKFKKALELISENKMLQTTFYKFMSKIQDAFIVKDFNIIIAAANKYNKKASTADRSEIVRCVTDVASPKRDIDVDKKDAVLALLEKSALYEKDEKAKKGYIYRAEVIKDPSKQKGIPAMRMI